MFPPLPAGPAPDHSKRRRWLWRLGLAALLLLAMAAALPGLLQALLLDQLPDRLSKVLGRTVTLQAGATGSVTARGPADVPADRAGAG